MICWVVNMLNNFNGLKNSFIELSGAIKYNYYLKYVIFSLK